MSNILEIVSRALDENNWHYERIEEKGAIHFTTLARNGRYAVLFRAHDKRMQLVLTVFSPVKVPENRRLAMAEYLTRANYGLILGNFAMDMADGEVHYKVSVDFEDGLLSPKMANNMLGVGISMMDRYFPGLLSVAFANRSPAETVDEIEGNKPGRDCPAPPAYPPSPGDGFTSAQDEAHFFRYGGEES